MILFAWSLSRRRLAWALYPVSAVFALASPPICAQVISVVSVDAGEPDLGTVASAASGDTVFRIAPDTGVVSKQSGAGVRVSSGSTRGRVVVTCIGGAACDTATETVTITDVGSPTGRARALTNFTVAPGANAPTLGTPSGTNPITFTVSGIPSGTTRDFYVGADFGIAPSGLSGLATSGFLVTVGVSALPGEALANVLRPLSLNKSSDLSFGSILRPSSGSGGVTFDATNATRDVTGTGAMALGSPTPTLAQYSVSGEGGQTFSIDVNGENEVEMTGPGTLTVTLNDDADAFPALDGAPGEEGFYSFRVGGTFSMSHDTPVGAYSGNFLVTVNYN